MVHIPSGIYSGWYAYKSSTSFSVQQNIYFLIRDNDGNNNIELDPSNGQYSDWIHRSTESAATSAWVAHAFSNTGSTNTPNTTGYSKYDVTTANDYSNYTFTIGS